jgi:Ca-activated chloride channel family protein
MQFAEPLWLLVGLMACGLLVWTWRLYDVRQRAALGIFAASHLHAQLTASFSTARRNWKRALFLASVALMFAALARPQAGYHWQEAKRRGIEILFAVDTSKSMLTPDVKPNRLTRAKLAVDDFVSRLDGDGVGLVAFAGNAFLQCPITLDYNAFNESLAALDTNTISRGGTDISSAIREAQASLQDRPSTDKILILLTDGEDLEGDAVDTAKAAAQAGLKIYTVGVGTANGDLIPLPADNGGGFVKDDSGQYVKSHLDESTLQAIAQATGGIYAPLGAQGQGLDTIYQKALAPLRKHDLASRQERVYIERYQWCLLPALLFLLGSLLIGTRRAVKRVRRTESVPLPVMPRLRQRVPQTVATLLTVALLVSTQAKASVRDAETAYQKGEYTMAQKAFEAAAQNHAHKNTLLFDAGTAAYKAGQYAEATEDFQKSLEAKPSSDPTQLEAQDDAYYNLGNTLYRTGQKTEKSDVKQTIQTWEQAVKSYDAALQIRKDDTDSEFNRDLVQKRLDALKKQQQQKQDEQKKQDQAEQNKSEQQKQNQGQQAQNQPGKSGQNSEGQDQKTASNRGSQGQSKTSQGPSSWSPNQASNGSNQQGNTPDQSQSKNPAQQRNQRETAQNSNGPNQEDGSKPDQQGQPVSDNGEQKDRRPSPQNPGGQQPASALPNGGSSVAQNGQPVDQTGQDSERPVPGQMSKQEARQLLDSLRGEQKALPGNAVARAATENNPDQPLKDW